MYISLVTVKGSDGRTYLRTAPAWVDLTADDEVMIETSDHPHEIRGKVIDVATFNPEGEEYRLMKSFVRGDDITMKVTKKILYKVYNYDDLEEKGDVANG